MITLLWYLSDVAEGGETVFPLTGENAFPSERQVTMSSCERGLKVRPKKGAALLWYNMLPHGNGHEGRPDRQSLHGGCDVLAGEKWASNKWVYNHKWDNRDLVDTHVEGMARRRDEPVRQPAYPTMEELEQATGAGAGDARAPNEIDAAFVNKHDKAVKLFWIGNGGEELEMATIAVGGSQPFNTYATHQWVARDIDSGQAVSLQVGSSFNSLRCCNTQHVRRFLYKFVSNFPFVFLFFCFLLFFVVGRFCCFFSFRCRKSLSLQILANTLSKAMHKNCNCS